MRHSVGWGGGGGGGGFGLIGTKGKGRRDDVSGRAKEIKDGRSWVEVAC